MFRLAARNLRYRAPRGQNTGREDAGLPGTSRQVPGKGNRDAEDAPHTPGESPALHGQAARGMG